MAGTRITIAPAGEAVCAALGIATAQDLLALEGGTVVAQSRTTKTVRLETDAGNAYLKRYFVPTFKDWFRGALRWTWLGKSKAQREWENYARLEQAGWGIPERLAWADVSTGAGALEGCGILTAEIPQAERLDVAWLKRGVDRRSLLDALAARVRRSHDSGYFDRNLYARNILVRDTGGGWGLFKLDSPRAGSGGSADDDLAALDAFGRNACSLRERWRFWRRYTGPAPGGETCDLSRAAAERIDQRSLELQEREAARFTEAQELAVA